MQHTCFLSCSVVFGLCLCPLPALDLVATYTDMASSEVAEHPKHGSPEHDVPHDQQEQLCGTEQSDSVKEPGDAHQSDQLQESTSEAKLGDNGDSAMDHSHTDSARPR